MLGSQQFFKLEPHAILNAVEQMGVRCTGRCLALNSMENRVYEVEIETGEEPSSPSDRFRIAKFYRPGRWSEEQILEEHEFLLDLYERELPVVPPLRDAEGRTVTKLEGLDIYCALFPKAGGRNPQELSDDEMAMMGRLLARVHAIGAMKEAPHRLRLTPGTYGRENLEYLLQSGAIPRHLQSSYESLVTTLCDRMDLLFAGVKTHRLHGDCHLGNVVWGSEGPRLVDFDDMVMGPPVQDIWLLIPGRDEYAKRGLERFIEGYEQMRFFDRSTLRLIEPLRALRLIHFSAWIQRRWEDPAFKAVFSQFGSEGYWQEQIGDLRDQLSLVEEDAVGWP